MSKDTLGGCVFLSLDFKPFFFDLGFVKLRARQWHLCDFTGITFKYPYHVFFFWFTIFFFRGLWWLQRTHDSYYNRKVVTYDFLFLVYRLTFLLFFVCSLLMRGHDMSRRAAHRTWNGHQQNRKVPTLKGRQYKVIQILGSKPEQYKLDPNLEASLYSRSRW